MKKTVSLILSLTMLFSMAAFMATPVSAASVEQTIKYDSRENYPKTAVDTNEYNWDKQWSAQVYDPALNNGAGGFEPMILNTTNMTRFTAESANNNSAMNWYQGAMVYEAGMWPTRYTPTDANELAKAERIYAAQVFAAPYDGYYKIHAASVPNGMDAPINARIRKNGQAMTGGLDWVGSGNFSYGDIGVELNAGDLLSFETGYKAVEGVVTFASGGTVDWKPVVIYYGKDTYKSTDAYPSAVTADGTWDSGNWAAKIYDPQTSTYYPLTATGGAAGRFTVSSDIAEAATSTSEYNKYHGATVMSGTAMWPTRQISGNSTTAQVAMRSYVAIVFTAPKSGWVKISGGSITNTLTANGVIARIRKNTDANALVSKTLASVNGSATYEDLYIEVAIGDMISFEAGIDGALVNNDSGYVTWTTPIVTYTDTRTTFQASQNFSKDSNNGAWDKVWSAAIYNPKFEGDGYIPLTTVIDAGYALAQSTPSGNSYNPIYGGAPTVGANMMMPSKLTTSGSTTLDVKTAYVAQVFTAPRPGWVSITGANGNKLSFVAASDETIKMNVQVRKVSGSDSVVLKKMTLDAGDSSYSDIYGVYLNAGDKVSFEAAYNKVSEVEGSLSGTGGTLAWDPIVTYINEPAVGAAEVEFTKGGSKVTSFADITGGTTAVTADVFVTSAVTAKMFVGVYNANGVLEACAVSDDVEFEENETTTVSAQLVTDSSMDDGIIRIFILEDNLSPVLSTVQTYLYE